MKYKYSRIQTRFADADNLSPSEIGSVERRDVRTGVRSRCRVIRSEACNGASWTRAMMPQRKDQRVPSVGPLVYGHTDSSSYDRLHDD